MPRKPKPPPDDPEQSKRFIDMAREIGANASKEEFDRLFRKVANRSTRITTPPSTKPKPKP
jgi:hypothetical protein